MATTSQLPIPSLIRASSWDAGNESMRAAGRKVWSREDFNAAAATQERLVRACFGYKTDRSENQCFIRFGVAEAFEKIGAFSLTMKAKEFYRIIDDYMDELEQRDEEAIEAAKPDPRQIDMFAVA